MIGDREVLVPDRDAGFHHGRHRIPSVAVRGMHVQIAADVAALDQGGQLSDCRGLERSSRASHLGRQVDQARPGVDFLLLAEIGLPGSAQNRGHVRCRARRPEHRRSAIGRPRDADVELVLLMAHDDTPARTMRDAGEPRQRADVVHRCLGIVGGGNQHQRTDQRLKTPDVPGRLDPGHDGAVFGYAGNQTFERVPRPPQRGVRRIRSKCGRGGPHALRRIATEELFQTPVVNRLLQVGPDHDAEPGHEGARFRRGDRLQLEQPADERWNAQAREPQCLLRPGLDQFGDSSAKGSRHTAHLAQSLLARESRDVPERPGFHALERVREPAQIECLERCATDLGEVGKLPEGVRQLGA
jgi:hypothetical protein